MAGKVISLFFCAHKGPDASKHLSQCEIRGLQRPLKMLIWAVFWGKISIKCAGVLKWVFENVQKHSKIFKNVQILG
ncbi:hypothetical protein ES703_38542 [subsurface metagenome]